MSLEPEPRYGDFQFSCVVRSAVTHITAAVRRILPISPQADLNQSISWCWMQENHYPSSKHPRRQTHCRITCPVSSDCTRCHVISGFKVFIRRRPSLIGEQGAGSLHAGLIIKMTWPAAGDRLDQSSLISSYIHCIPQML